jgi:hypothetical protein
VGKSKSLAKALDKPAFLVDRYDRNDFAFARSDISNHCFEVCFGRNITSKKENASYGSLLEILDDLAKTGVGIFCAEKPGNNHLPDGAVESLVGDLSCRVG